MKLKNGARIIERAEKKVYLILGDKELCLSDDPELETAVNKLYFGNIDVEDATLKQLDGFVE